MKESGSAILTMGIIEQIIFYQKGLPEGESKLFDHDSHLIQQGAYREGLETGIWNFYNPYGNLILQGEYKEGKPVGTWYEFKKGKKKIYKRYTP